MVYDGWNCYFLFSAIFCPLTPLTALKKNLQKWKKQQQQQHRTGDIIILHKVPKNMIICYTVPEIYGV